MSIGYRYIGEISGEEQEMIFVPTERFSFYCKNNIPYFTHSDKPAFCSVDFDINSDYFTSVEINEFPDAMISCHSVPTVFYPWELNSESDEEDYPEIIKLKDVYKPTLFDKIKMFFTEEVFPLNVRYLCIIIIQQAFLLNNYLKE